MSAVEVIDRLASLGCVVLVDGEKLRVRGPNLPEVAGLVSQLRRNREAALEFLTYRQSEPLSIDQVKALLPAGVQLLSYQLRQTPFAVAPISVVTNAGKFFRSYLGGLAWRLDHPNGHAAPPLVDILLKLGRSPAFDCLEL